MNSRDAWFWVFTAAILLLALVAYDRLFHRPPPGPAYLMPTLKAEAVDTVRVLPAGAEEIQVQRTNGAWRLTRPLSYPAQSNSIEALLQALETAVPATRIGGAELRTRGYDLPAYGLVSPRASLILTVGGGRQQLLIGSLTAPGDQVFVQAVGEGGVSVVDAELLKLIPASANMWRDTTLFSLSRDAYDSITVTSGQRVLELKKDSSDHSWRVVRPMQARADDALVDTRIQGLIDLSVSRFVSDNPRADREAWGLQPPGLEIVFARGTNRLRTLQFGDAVETETDALYAVGLEPTAVVVVASDPVQAWKATPNEFRDRQLLRLSRAVSSIEVSNGETFSLVNTTNGTWRIEPLGWPADPATVRRFVQALEVLRVARFVKDVVAEPDLPGYGLAAPALRMRFHLKPGKDGQPASEVGLDFGSRKDETVFVRRVDENAVYAVDFSALQALPAAPGHFRQLRVWSFDEDQVTSLTLQQGGSTWRLLHNGPNQWSLAPGSQGVVNAFAVEDVAHRLGELKAVAWTDWNQTNLVRYGVGDDSMVLTVELKDGSRKSVRFGFPAPSSHVYAATVLEGGSWVFEFPSDTYDRVRSFLIKPSNLR